MCLIGARLRENPANPGESRSLSMNRRWPLPEGTQPRRRCRPVRAVVTPSCGRCARAAHKARTRGDAHPNAARKRNRPAVRTCSRRARSVTSSEEARAGTSAQAIQHEYRVSWDDGTEGVGVGLACRAQALPKPRQQDRGVTAGRSSTFSGSIRAIRSSTRWHFRTVHCVRPSR